MGGTKLFSKHWKSDYFIPDNLATRSFFYVLSCDRINRFVVIETPDNYDILYRTFWSILIWICFSINSVTDLNIRNRNSLLFVCVAQHFCTYEDKMNGIKNKLHIQTTTLLLPYFVSDLKWKRIVEL